MSNYFIHLPNPISIHSIGLSSKNRIFTAVTRKITWNFQDGSQLSKKMPSIYGNGRRKYGTPSVNIKIKI